MLSTVTAVFFALLAITQKSKGDIVSQTLRVSSVTTYADGVKKANTLTYNGIFPGPLIQANLGDQLKISVVNSLNEPTSVHWHGLFQNGTQFQDGPSMVTQCPIAPGQTQVYNFAAAQSGTYWYHAHQQSQYTDGLVGPLVIRDPTDSSTYGYDDEIIVILSDWYHTDYHTNENFYMSTGVPPFPNSPVINGHGQFPCLVVLNILGQPLSTPQCYSAHQVRSIYRVMPGKTYRIRVINTSAMSAFTFSIDGHKLRAIEVDGVSLAAPSSPVDFVSVGTAQRYSFVMTMDQPINKYTIRSVMKTDFLSLFNSTPNLNVNAEKTLRPVATAVLFYDPTLLTPTPLMATEPFSYIKYYLTPQDNRKSLIFLEDSELSLLPQDGQVAPSSPTDLEFTLNISLTLVTTPSSPMPVPHSLINGNAFVRPDIGEEPLLFQIVRGEQLTPNRNPLIVGKMQTVQIIINNDEPLQHPIHLHGHTFWVVGKGQNFAGHFDPTRDTLISSTIKRDTVIVNANSWVVIRFVADNPGVWTMHCHIDWHNAGGMVVTIVEGQEALVGTQIPEETTRVCTL